MMLVVNAGKGGKLMTVLLGAKTEKTVILAGDNRGTNKNTDETQDILEKVHPINNHHWRNEERRKNRIIYNT